MNLSLTPRPEPSRVEVRGSPTRCPYCHAGCAASDTNAVCNQCLARHHAECWAETRRCSNCAASLRLEPVVRPAKPKLPASVRKRQRRASASSVAILLASMCTGFVAFAKPGLTAHGYLEAVGILTLVLPVFSFASGWFSGSARWAASTALAAVIAAWLGSLGNGHHGCGEAHLLLLWPAALSGVLPGLLAARLRRRAAATAPRIRLKPKD